VTRVGLAGNFEPQAEGLANGNLLAYLQPGFTGPSAALAGVNTELRATPGGFVPPLVVRARDSAGRPSMGRPVTWTATNLLERRTMAATSGDGYAQALYQAPSTEGTYTATAAVDGRTVQFNIVVAQGGGGNGGNGGGGEEGRVRVVSGQGQVVNMGLPPGRPITVQVLDDAGEPAEGVEVTWTIETLVAGTAQMAGCTGSSATQRICTTDAEGKASIQFVGTMVPLHAVYSQFRLAAEAAGDSTSVYVTVLPTGRQLEVSIEEPDNNTTLTLQRGVRLNGAIHVRTWAEGVAAIPHVGVVLSASNAAADVQCFGGPGAVFSDDDGLAVCSPIAMAGLGQTDLTIEVGGVRQFPNWVDALLVPGPPATIVKSTGDNQSGRPGDVLPMHLSAFLQDAAGTPIAGATASWEVVSGSATVNPTTSTADATGKVSTQVTLGPTAGPVVIRLISGIATADFNLTNNVAIGGMSKVSGDNQSAAQGAAFASPLVVKVTGTDGAGLQGVAVNFAVTAGTATLSAASVPTDATGQASVTVTAGNTPGPVTVTATAAGTTQTQTFSLAVRLPGPVLTEASFMNGASFVYSPGLAFGSIATIQAEGLLGGSPAIAAGSCVSTTGPGPLPTRVANVEVLFSGNLAPIYAVCRTVDNKEQVNVQVPFELAPADIAVTVRTGAGTSSQIEATIQNIRIVNANPGVFQYQTGGRTLAVAVRPNGTVVSPANPARKGETLRIFATGLGPVLPWVGTNQLGTPGQRPFFAVVVALGGSGVSGIVAAYAENQVGLFTVDFPVPESAPSGDVQLRLDVITDQNQTVTGNTVTIPIQ
jgi:uncharacterized protein (TIGR03437 family)